MGVFAQILEYAGQNNCRHPRLTVMVLTIPNHSRLSTPIPQMDYDSLDAIGEVQTIMVYLVGSDLESDYGNASLDLDEMERPEWTQRTIIFWSMPVVHPNGRTAACPVTNAPSCC